MDGESRPRFAVVMQVQQRKRANDACVKKESDSDSGIIIVRCPQLTKLVALHCNSNQLALTKRLALYVEGAFSRVRATTDAEGRAMNVSYSRLRVLRMSANFLVDSAGALWFTHCGDAVTQSLAPPAPDPATVAAIAAETAAAAEAELRNLIRAA